MQRKDDSLSLDGLLDAIDFFDRFFDPELRYAALRTFCEANDLDYGSACQLAALYLDNQKNFPNGEQFSVGEGK